MDPDQAIALLGSPNPDDRLAAARILSVSARRQDAHAIADALSREPDRWVGRSLSRALAYAQDRRTRRKIAVSLTSEGERNDELLSVATANVTRLLLHEFNPLIGDIRRHAQREIDPYEPSRTHAAIDRLDRLVDAIATLNSAASPAEWQEFDLGGLATLLTTDCIERTGVAIELAGPDPLIVRGDERLIEMAIDQGLRNAVDASLGVTEVLVSVNWAANDHSVTVVISDRGPGLPPGFDRTLTSVATTKDKREHQGLGLMTANRAARSLGGTIAVAPRLGGGTTFMLSWPVKV